MLAKLNCLWSSPHISKWTRYITFSPQKLKQFTYSTISSKLIVKMPWEKVCHVQNVVFNIYYKCQHNLLKNYINNCMTRILCRSSYSNIQSNIEGWQEFENVLWWILIFQHSLHLHIQNTLHPCTCYDVIPNIHFDPFLQEKVLVLLWISLHITCFYLEVFMTPL